MKVISPLAVYLPRKTKKDKKVILNLNQYRNLQYIVSNQAKVIYTDMMREQLEGHKFKKISLCFKYFKGSKRKCDRANVYSIVEKFLCDACVHWGVIEDDSDEFIFQTVYLPVEYDKENPRVEVEILEVV